MQYTVEVTINKDIDTCVRLFKDQDFLYKWLVGLKKIEPLTGEPGKQGSTARITSEDKGREYVMTETILIDNLPQEFKTSYEMKGTYNTVSTRFEKIDDNTTKCIGDNEFTFSGFFMKMMGMLMPGAFKKMSQKYMDNFKKAVEEHKD